jgi:PAS domain-containing protein
VIVDVAHAASDAVLAPLHGWVGRKWQETAADDSRIKVDQLLREVAATGSTARRQVNHVTPDGLDLPVAYHAVRLGRDGHLIAVGRDLRNLAQLQQRLVETQQALERDYWKLRHVETRLPAALPADHRRRCSWSTRRRARWSTRTPPRARCSTCRPSASSAAPSRTTSRSRRRRRSRGCSPSTRLEGRSDDVELVVGDGRPVRASASSFRQEAQTLFLVRFTVLGDSVPARREDGPAVMELLAGAPDAFAVTTLTGELLTVNRSFLDLAQLTDEKQALGRSIGDWIGRPGADLPVLLAMLKKHGALRLISTAARGEHGSLTEVELSSVWAPRPIRRPSPSSCAT